jgi:AraC-like DNA-binding protein
MEVALQDVVLNKNTPKGKVKILFEKDNLKLSTAENDSGDNVSVDSLIEKSFVHFFFCLDGSAHFIFNPHYSREIQKQKNYFFYDPEKDLPFELELSPKAKLIFMSLPLESLHHLFVHEPLPFLRPENVNRRFYDERDIPSSLFIVLSQLFSVHLSETAQKLFYQGKVYELLSLYFSDRKPDTESCPFLNDQETVRKIKHAKEFLLKNIDTPPGLKELAKAAGLNEYQLKVGFKQIYGNTVYGFLNEHKLDNARVLLDTRKYQVNEVAYQIGYTNPSHFIAAFRKKYGVTPKKYLMSRARSTAS